MRRPQAAATVESMATLSFHIVPNAKIDRVMGEHGGAIKIKLRAPVVEGKANAALRSFLSKELKIAERRIVLEHGRKSREKIVRIDGLTDEEVRRRLRAVGRNMDLQPVC
jgi:uncharacterized protein (TIGR00251 family)